MVAVYIFCSVFRLFGKGRKHLWNIQEKKEKRTASILHTSSISLLTSILAVNICMVSFFITCYFRQLAETLRSAFGYFRQLAETLRSAFGYFRQLAETLRSAFWYFRQLAEMLRCAFWYFRQLAETLLLTFRHFRPRSGTFTISVSDSCSNARRHGT
jgi:hypothetical protein